MPETKTKYSIRELAQLASEEYNPETWRANALLIAAAPELLEALKGVVRVADRKTREFDAARAAIAKAEGKASPAEGAGE